MKAQRYIWCVLSAMTVFALTVACESSQFTGQTGRVTPKPTPAVTPPPQQMQSTVDFDCMAKKANTYNITLVLDNSGSQKENDPNKVRRAAAIRFVERFVDFSQTEQGVVVRFSVIGFNTQVFSSNIGSNGWVDLNKSTAGIVEDAITKATDNPEGGTLYTPVLNEAQRLMQSLPAPTNDKTRNYVVFLTDGLPNMSSGVDSIINLPGGKLDTRDAILGAVNNLVKQSNAAMITIGAGQDVVDSGLTGSGDALILSEMALPTTNAAHPDQVGIFLKAKSADDLQSVWDKLFAHVAQCY